MTAEFREFDSLEEMRDWMRRQTAAANERTSDRQKAITFGDHWMRFIPQHQLVVFGRVEPLEDLAGVEDPPTIDHIRENLGRGYLFGRAYSTWEPDGEWGDTHTYNVWPCTPELFEAAQEAGWDITRLEPVFGMQVNTAYREYREWILAQPSEGMD
jgi:hypothetical protein